MRGHFLCIWIILSLQGLFAQCSNCEQTIDVVDNGDFESGNISFSSDFQYTSSPGILCPLCPEDRYAIGTNAQEFHSNFSGLDHTQPGTGNFMICNGDSLPNVEVWCQTVNVTPATFYTFSFWASNVNNNANPHPLAQLQIRINGVLLPDIFEIEGDWEQASAQWYNGNNTQITLCILNQQSSGGGNDFGIDDISFYTCRPIEPSAPAELGDDIVICGGETIALGMAASGNYSYQWYGLPSAINNNNSNQIITLENTSGQPLQYEFILNADTAGICLTADSISVTVLSFEPLSIETDLLICPHDSILYSIPDIYDAIEWSDGNTSSSRYLTPGNYALTIHQSSCSDITHISIDVPENPPLNLGADIQGCSNNLPVLESDYIGLWSDGSISDSLPVQAAGEYHQTITLDGCTYSDTILVEIFDVPSLYLGNDTTLCAGQSIDLTAGDVWDFTLWSNGLGGSSLTVSQGGTYHLTAIIDNCIARDTIQLSFIESIQLDLGNDTTLCEGDTLVIRTAASGTWNNTFVADSLLIVSSGQYSFTYSPGACQQTDEIEVSIQELPTLNIGNDTSICAGTTIPLTAGIGWESVEWSNGSTQTEILTGAGILQITASLNTCSLTDQIIIFPITPIDLDLGPDTTLCDGENLLLTTPVTGEWNGILFDDTLWVTQSGTYTFTYGNEGCIQTDEILVYFDPRPYLELISDTTICRDDEVILTAGGGWAEVLWNASISADTIIASEGIYYLYAASGACQATDTIIIHEYESLQIELGNDTVLCENSELVLNTEIIGIWNGSTTGNTFTVQNPGEYTFTYTDGLCDFTNSITINYLEVPAILPLQDTSICPWDSYTMTIPSWPGTITWSNGSNSLSQIMTQGNNTVIGEFNGCETIETFTLNYFPIETHPAIPDTTVCSDLGLTLSLLSPVQWSNGSFDQEILITIDGNYTYLSEEFGCIQTDTFNVTVQLEPETGLPSEVALCGEQVEVTSLVDGEWSNGQSGTTAVFNQPGNFTFHVMDSACSLTYPITIYLAEYPTITLEETVRFCEESRLEIAAEITGAENYYWTDTTAGLTREISMPGTYTLIAENACGYSADSIRAENYPCYYGLYIPSAFTPNEDRINEGWRVFSFNLKEIDIRIYNRFGDLVFMTQDFDTFWNPGTEVGDDVYNYRILALTFDGKVLREYGPIYLLR
jgi:gliding motility-associated-like protein